MQRAFISPPHGREQGSKNTPEALAGGNPPDDTKDQAAAKEKEIRSKIAALTIQHME